MAFFQESFNLKIGNKGRKDKRLSKNNKWSPILYGLFIWQQFPENANITYLETSDLLRNKKKCYFISIDIYGKACVFKAR